MKVTIIFRIIGVAESETEQWRRNFDDLLLGIV